MTVEERFWAKVDPDGDCWIWQGGVSDGRYGSFTPRKGKHVRAHRWAYEHLTQTVIPDGMVIDHICRRTLCVNPDHLDVVTQRENLMRAPSAVAAKHAAKTHCKNGHEFTPENTYRRSKKHPHWRLCKQCVKDSKQRAEEAA